MPTQVVPTLTPLPAPPNPGAPSTFAGLAFAFTVAQRDAFRPELAALGANVKFNADDALANAAASAADRVVTTADRVVTTADRVVTTADRVVTTADRIAAAASAVQASKLNLGSKAIEPALDNQGAALLTGTAYYDTVLVKWRVWNGAAWADGITSVSGVATVNGQSGVVTITNILQPVSRRAFITARTTHTIPIGVTSARVYAVGAGAAGNANVASGGGGGMAFGNIAVVVGDVLTINIAAGVATVVKGGVTMLTGNPGSGVTGGTASKDAAVTSAANITGGAGNTNAGAGGASSGSPLGAVAAAVAVTAGGSGWGGIGGLSGGGGGVGGGATAAYGGAGLTIPSIDPLLFGLTGLGGNSGASATAGGNGQAGAGGGFGLGAVGGAGGFGGGGGNGGNGVGGAGGFGGGGGGGGGGGNGGVGGFGGGGGAGAIGGAGGAAAVLIFY